MPPFYLHGANPRTSFASLQTVCQYHRQREQARDNARYAIHSHATEHVGGIATSSPVPLGVQRLRHFQDLMANGYRPPFHKPTYFTKKWDKCVTPALAASIVGKEDWKMHGQRICEENGWTHVTPQAACSTMRQIGKTCNLGRTVTSMGEAVPGEKHIICTTGRRISMYVISVVEAYMNHRGHGKDITVTHPTQGSRIVWDHGGGVISEVIGLPDNPRISTCSLSLSLSQSVSCGSGGDERRKLSGKCIFSLSPSPSLSNASVSRGARVFCFFFSGFGSDSRITSELL